MSHGESVYLTLANKISEKFKAIECVEAIALGGSQTSGSLDKHSDIDLYIYSSETISLAARQEIVDKLGASKADLNLTFWDLGDQWFDLETGIEVDIIYWDKSWIEEQLQRLLISHQANMGYTTCFWQTVSDSKILFDRSGWFTQLQNKYKVSYPEPLKQAIISKNQPVLRDVIPSYYTQIKKALDRQDLLSINHRLAALFASYFDVLYAVNKVMNPGEKKVLNYVLQNCAKVPADLHNQVNKILQSAAVGDRILLNQLDELLDGLDNLLAAES
ncbi:nucleotidyltransferase domain-containing protein [Psychromonas ossibalaenae]|uniref:nucleotidyltransferase domain-containing protein n=1 Tax=Psychromonas ossibalaenae TaxID=444922 RepID=UPI00036BD572|nr:nucleotidyltransferase domain-containing protein [Psychromonas ossibalaenae]